jgi:hypothetical protein
MLQPLRNAIHADEGYYGVGDGDGQTTVPAESDVEVLVQVEPWRALVTKEVSDGKRLLSEVLEGPLRFTPEEGSYESRER